MAHLLSLLLLPLALAAGPRALIESAPTSTREELTPALEAAEARGWDTRVVRKQDPEGARYVLIVEGFEDKDSAQQAAQLLSAEVNLGFAVQVKGRSRDTAAPQPGPAAEEPDPFDAQDALAKASEALGGPEAGLAALKKQPRLVFRYDRSVVLDGVTYESRQEWVQQGDELRLSTQVLSGPGVSSVTLIAGGKAWVTAGDRAEPRDLARTQEVIAPYAPEALLSYPLRLAELVANDPSWDQLTLAAEADCATGRCWILEGQGSAGPMRLTLDTRTGYPLELEVGEGDSGLLYRFDDWHKLDIGVVVPLEVEMFRGGKQLQKVRVTELSSPKSLPEGTLTPPTAP